MEFTELPFEYSLRYADRHDDLGVSFDAAVILEERDRELEDFLATVGGMPVIDMGDGAVPTGFSKGWWVSSGSSLRRVVGTLSVAGSSDTVANVIRDGSTVGSITIPSGDLVAYADVDAPFAADEFWQMQVTSAGTGAGGLTFFGVFS